MRFDDSPEPAPPGMLQAGFEKKVMHASFRVRGIPLMASDGRDDRSKSDEVWLALALPANLPLRDDILISAFAVVAFSVIVQGLTAPLALKALRLTPGKRAAGGF